MIQRTLVKHYLHSTLIKYKGRKLCFHFSIYHIYIPLWLNIKEDNICLITTEQQRNLHSTLIKYKVHLNISHRRSNHIYIPLWLNIKITRPKSLIYPILIYIPLWLNIKVIERKERVIIKSDLHSTLIKYKVKVWEKLVLCRFYIYIPLWLNIKP